MPASTRPHVNKVVEMEGRLGGIIYRRQGHSSIWSRPASLSHSRWSATALTDCCGSRLFFSPTAEAVHNGNPRKNPRAAGMPGAWEGMGEWAGWVKWAVYVRRSFVFTYF
ncbi:UNVERIFIED_CONTAM: hypothetical protein GTU68_000732 [Idotea baltica]|nr:hypothetical protein [Idotea baltica]